MSNHLTHVFRFSDESGSDVYINLFEVETIIINSSQTRISINMRSRKEYQFVLNDDILYNFIESWKYTVNKKINGFIN